MTNDPASTLSRLSRLSRHRLSLDHAALARGLRETERLLIIQDLDGVCMGLVRDPLTRTLERRYLEAAGALAGEFFVLTNGEHVGTRGVNRLVEAALGVGGEATGRYLPGAGGGGVQLQDTRGEVSHPGVTEAELAFLAAVPARACETLSALLQRAPLSLDAAEARRLATASVLDNAVSPTVNLNVLHAELADRPEAFRQLQAAVVQAFHNLVDDAARGGLPDAFFVHLAPNLGRGPDGRERMRPARDGDAGTTDVQLMLRGAVKEAGVLVLLNRYFHHHHGHYPLGADFNVREAPRDLDALAALAADRFDPALMPRIVAVGDTVTASPDGDDMHRGGSDRGFLTLVQAIGDAAGSDNVTLFVDSSSGEVHRPGLAGDALAAAGDARWRAVEGISDPADPLALNFLFPGGHTQYVDFFCALAAARRGRKGR